MNRNDAQRSFCAIIGHWHLRGWGGFLIEDEASGEFVGRAGINDREGWHEPELRWWVVPAMWGRGYAAEADRAVLDYVKTTGRTSRLVSYVRPRQSSVGARCRKLGAVVEREIDYCDGVARMYVHSI
jgi:RimJ/RimL family protein N-acetyltransferase